MNRIFTRIFFSHLWSIGLLFTIIVFTGTLFITLGQLTANTEKEVTSQTRPIFGADIVIRSPSYTGARLIDIFAPSLSWANYSFAEKKEFSTTLFDQKGNIWLVRVVTYSGSYPQRGTLVTKTLAWESVERWNLFVNAEILARFASGNSITIDGKSLPVTDIIVESSDIGIGFGTENALVILSENLLSGSLLLSSGSRLESSLLLSFSWQENVQTRANALRSEPRFSPFRIETYTERARDTIDIVKEISRYILLILVLSSIFTLVVLRSAHERFFESLTRTLRICEILGLTRKKQISLFILFYTILIPLALLVSLGVSWLFIELFASFPLTSSFHIIIASLGESLFILVLLIVWAFFSAWETYLRQKQKNRNKNLGLHIHSWEKNFTLRKAFSFLRRKWISYTSILLFLLSWIIFSVIFSDVMFAFILILSWLSLFFFLSLILWGLYRYIFRYVSFLRWKAFYSYDAFRTLVRPYAPTIPVTLSLISVTSIFFLFSIFSLAFRDRLIFDAKTSPNVFALNILESDRPKVEQTFSGIPLYSIMRARISSINGVPLGEFLGSWRMSGEFTREFNITTSPLSDTILEGNARLSDTDVSVDRDFASRLWVKRGDEIEFLLSWKRFRMNVSNIRASERMWFQPFFYFQFSEKAFALAPKTYFLSTYSSDVEGWKKRVLAQTGPHVTFVDVEEILSIIRDIGGKVLSLIALFFTIVGIFAVGAIHSFFARLEYIESIKRRIYPFFGASRKVLSWTFLQTRFILAGIAYCLSLIIGTGASLFIMRSSTFLVFSWRHFIVVSLIIALAYALLIFLSLVAQKFRYTSFPYKK